MSRGWIRVYVHLVWSTKHFRPTLTDEHEQLILESFKETCKDLGLVLYAANGAWNHVHLIIGWTQSVCIDDAVRELKSRSWHACRQHAEANPLCSAVPRWQRGYGALSVDQERLGVVIRYIQRQKQHHQRPKELIAKLEECEED